MRLSDADMLRAFDELGVEPSELISIRAPGSLASMQVRLKEFQSRVKRGFKEAALRLHPDVTPNNPEALELFKLVSEVVRQLMALRVQERPKPPVHADTTCTFSTQFGKVRINIKVKDE
jgi:hypothetical protein